MDVIQAARNLLMALDARIDGCVNAYSQDDDVDVLNCRRTLDAAIEEYDKQLEKHSERPQVIILKCVQKKGRVGKRSTDIILDKGDTGTIIGYGTEKMVVQ